MDTIFALATAPGKAGVAIVRVSGEKAHAAAQALSGKTPPIRVATLARFRSSKGMPIDSGLLLLFAEDASFTGEKVAEFQIHGARATVAALLAELGTMEGLRLAEPGEFTRRALENGRMDLTEVEGLADLIDAETEAQRKQALEALSGALGEKAAEWRSRLVEAMALVEVTIDFADEDVPVDVGPEVSATLGGLSAEIGAELSGISAARQIREGFEIAILGPPNVGKSTLLNRLAQREAALVSDIAGTTRDIVEVRMDVGGHLVTFLDTAGIRESTDIVESMGVARARDRAERADLRVVLVDGTGPVIPPRDGDIVLQAKADLYPEASGISGKTGQGVADLLEQISQTLAARVAPAGTASHERHRKSLASALAALDSARCRLGSAKEQADLTAEDLRQAVRALDALIGHVDVEDVLDQIFSAFCLGK